MPTITYYRAEYEYLSGPIHDKKPVWTYSRNIDNYTLDQATEHMGELIRSLRTNPSATGRFRVVKVEITETLTPITEFNFNEQGE